MGVRPRFKLYKKRGFNFFNSPRLVHRKLSMREVEKGKDIYCDIEPVFNEKLLLSPTQSQTEYHDGRTRRLKSVSSIIREHKNILKEIYGRDLRSHFGTQSRKVAMSKMKMKADADGDSRLNRFETRLDVLRQRAGLAMNPYQGAQIVTMGQVEVSRLQQDETTKQIVKIDNKVIKSPNYRVEDEMTRISIKQKYYKSYSKVLCNYQNNELTYHYIPSYREVDHTKGAFVLLQLPKDGEVYRPKGTAVGRASRQSY